MSDMEPITDDNREPAVSALCRIADELTELSNALFGYVNGTGDDVDRLEGIKTLLQDRLTEDMLSMAAMVTNHWKDYLEIRTHPSNTYALFLFAETFRQQKGIDASLDLSTIKALHEQVIAETEGPYSDEKEVEIQAKVVARWPGIDEGR